MIENTESDAPIYNRLLAALPAGEYRRLLPELEQIPLTYGENIYKSGDTIEYVYFPNSGIISLLAAAEKDSALEVGIVGREGIVGVAVFLGVKISNNNAIVQGQGFAMRMKAAAFLTECGKSGMLSRLLKRFTQSLLAQISQSAVCYRFHPAEDRLARWLLMTSDRMETKEFHLTQDFLSNMVGVRREAVNKSAVVLQQQELISYSRGNISITDRQGLELKACQCYAIIKAEETSFPVH
jgi:CRP-like cAMP-binding protein